MLGSTDVDRSLYKSFKSNILPAAEVSPIQAAILCFSGAKISGSETTFDWLHDVLFIHVHGVVIL